MTDSREKPPSGGTLPLVAAVFGRPSEVFRHAREKSSDTQDSQVGVAKPRSDFRLPSSDFFYFFYFLFFLTTQCRIRRSRKMNGLTGAVSLLRIERNS